MGYILESKQEQITSGYGSRPQFGDFHTGIDVVKKYYQIDNIIAFTRGKVIAVRTGCHEKTPSEGYGNYIKLQHNGGYETLYCHLKDVYVTVGQIVEAGQKIASMGQTGWSTGYHLHFEVRINGQHVNPAPYLQGQDIPAYQDPKPLKTIDNIAREVIAGQWGNGEDRKNKIVNAGYDYNTVQSKVNEMLNQKSSNLKSANEIAREVVRGLWGNGADRVNRLTQAGYSYKEIQGIVNQLLK